VERDVVQQLVLVGWKRVTVRGEVLEGEGYGGCTREASVRRERGGGECKAARVNERCVLSRSPVVLSSVAAVVVLIERSSFALPGVACVSGSEMMLFRRAWGGVTMRPSQWLVRLEETMNSSGELVGRSSVGAGSVSGSGNAV